jgi:hypothetical protein
MARAKSNEQGRTKPKPAAIDEVSRGIEKLKDLVAQVEDLSREGFPYQDAVRARTELSLRETIRRIFGERSEEYQTHKSHRLRASHRAESVATIAILKQLMARLEQQKSDMLGLKSTPAEPSDPSHRIGGASSPPIPIPDPDSTVDDTSIGTTQLNDSRRTLAATISSSNSQPSQAVTQESQGELPNRMPASEMSTSRESASATLNQSAMSPDPESITQRESNDSQATSATEPLASDLSVARGPAEPEPDRSSVAVLPTQRAATEGNSLNATAQHPVGTAAALQTIPSVPMEVTRPPATAPPAASWQEMPAPLECRPRTDLRQGPTAETSSVAEPFPVMQMANGNPLDHARDESPQSEDGSSTGIMARSHEVEAPIKSPAPAPKETSGFSSPVFPTGDSMTALRKVCTRFHLVARQLRLRRDYRPTLEVEDEYDVQDLLYALLRLEFDEVGTEDWSPPYEEGATRTSYLLHKDRIVIVAKKTKTGVTAKELPEQVKVDSSHYSGRADCRTLVCFIYDPEGRIGSPRGLESDLTMVGDTFTLEVIIAPK